MYKTNNSILLYYRTNIYDENKIQIKTIVLIKPNYVQNFLHVTLELYHLDHHEPIYKI